MEWAGNEEGGVFSIGPPKSIDKSGWAWMMDKTDIGARERGARERAVKGRHLMGALEL